MPNASRPICTPFRASTDIPSQQWITGPTLSRNPSRLELREMGFEEAYLMFSVDGWGVGLVNGSYELVIAPTECPGRIGDIGLG
jgi:hypothetical protein